MVAEMVRYSGKPYIWRGKGEYILQPNGAHFPAPTDHRGRLLHVFDCSGFVGFVIKACGGRNLLDSYWTDKYWADLPKTDLPRPGDVALYGGNGPLDVDHIEFVLSVVDGQIAVFGASGGTSSTATIPDAEMRNAQVSGKSSHLYRKDFRGFCDITSLLG